MKNKFTEMAQMASIAVSTAASKTTEFVQAHKPTDEDMEKAKSMALRAGKAVVDEAASIGKEMVESKMFRDAAKGAGVGAVVGVPLPIIGPGIGAIIGAGVGAYVGVKLGNADGPPQLSQTPPRPEQTVIEVLAAPPRDLHAELLKLDELRQKGLLTNDEFDTQKKKLLSSI